MSSGNSSSFTIPASPIGAETSINLYAEGPRCLAAELRFNDGTVLRFRLDPSAPLIYSRGEVVALAEVEITVLPIEGGGLHLVHSSDDGAGG